MSRTKILATVGGAALVAAMAACGSKFSHPGVAADCDPSVPCHVGSPGGVSANTPSEAGVDGGDVGGPLDAGPNSITISSAEVHSGTSFVHAPKSDPLDTVDPLNTLYVVSSVSHTGLVTGGLFSIPALDALPDTYGFFLLFNSSDTSFPTRTIGHVLHDTTTAETFPGPLYFPMYPTDLNATMGATVGATKPLANTATIIVQLIDATGAPVVGATATMTGASTDCTVATAPAACGPYYDAPDGNGIQVSAGGTGTNGTIVFLAIDGGGVIRTAPTNATVTVTKSGGAPTPLPAMALLQNAYSYVRHTLK
jgi:hypothetical protein